MLTVHLWHNVALDLVLIGLLYKAHPDGRQHRLRGRGPTYEGPSALVKHLT